MTKNIQFRDDACESIRNGIAKVARAARVTLGPCGRHVIIDQENGSIQVTKDGVTVVQQIELEDRFENMGARLLRQVATTTGDRAGDGTTTATLLAESIFTEGLKSVVAGVNPIEMEKGIRAAVQDVVLNLRKMSVPANDKRRLQQVATVASNGDLRMGELLSDALMKAGPEGLVLLEEGTASETEVDWIDGIHFDRGYLSPHFSNVGDAREVHLENAAILLCDHTLNQLPDLLPLLEEAAEHQRPLLIMAAEVHGDVLTSLVVNATRGALSCCAVKAPEFGDARRDALGDLAVFTGGTAFFTDAGIDLKNVRLSQLGNANRVVVTADSTTLLGGAGKRSDKAARMEQLRHLSESATKSERERISRRTAQLQGRVAKLRIGAQTESELKEKKARADDALHAARAARAEGIVPGGGTALLRAATASSPGKGESTDFKAGYRIVLKACRTPVVAIADNSGQSGTAICQKVLEASDDFGYDAARGEFVPMMRQGIVDATSVVRESLENAASLAKTLLTSDALITSRR